MDMLRTFVAVPLAGATRKHLLKWQDDLKAAGAAVKWVEAANLHITLRFIGDTPAQSVPAITAALREATASLPAFSITVGGLGAFPHRQSPRVIWAGVQEGKDALQALHRRVEAALQKTGIPPGQGRFSPHITLGRVRDDKVLPALSECLAVTAAACPPVLDKAGRIVFLQSVLMKHGPVYKPLAEFSLAGE